MNRTFSEQLIEEWLNLDGWLVKSGFPLNSTPSGGRDEADIVAIKPDGDKILVQHIEVGIINNGVEKDIKSIKKKFNEFKKKNIRDRINKLTNNEKIEIKQRYIATYINKNSYKKNYRKRV